MHLMKNIQWRNLALNALSRTSSTTGIEREFQFLLTLSWSDLLIILSSSPSISSCSLFFAAACLFCRRLSFLTSLLNCLWLKICPRMWIYKLIVHNIYYKKIEEFLFFQKNTKIGYDISMLGSSWSSSISYVLFRCTLKVKRAWYKQFENDENNFKGRNMKI